MGYVLGLDIGTNSVGWAAIDVDGAKLLAAGSRIFPEGVDRDTQGTEKSKNLQRRTARGHRRQISRRSHRKAALRKALQEAGIWTEAPSPELLATCPYELRARALDEKLTLPELGRALLHLNQRRGFLSNRKADRGRKKENSETLQAISQLAADIDNADARTLGEYFHKIRQQSPDQHPERVRGKHTRRDMFLSEFDRIWASQQRFHPKLLTDELKYGRAGQQQYPKEPLPRKRQPGDSLLKEFGFHGLMFFQRSLYWPKSVVGRCELEPREKRCERADRAAQQFRLLNEVNNLKLIPQKGEPRDLTPEERAAVISYLSAHKEGSFDQLRKQLTKFGVFDGDGFNLEIGKRTKLDGVPIDAALSHKKLFGARWKEFTEAQKDNIVRTLLDDEEPEILRKAVEEWGATQEIAEELTNVDLTAIVKGYAAYSRVAILKLLPHLEKGLRMMTKDGVPGALSAAGYLRPDQRKGLTGDQIPPPSERIVNPLVRQALYEVRKVVHAVIREFGKPAAIHVELAREVQGTAEKRAEATDRMRKQERKRDDAATFIRERGEKPTREAIERYLLWKEQGEFCAYSHPARMISPNQLFGGEVDIDHILPYSRTLDNSFMNKVVVFRSENDSKGNRTVREWVERKDPAKYDSILQRARNLPSDVRNAKLMKLQTQDVVLDKFLNRQLTDTAYITTQVVDLLRHLEGVDIVPVKGQCTAELRHHWGMNSLLSDDGLNLRKNRDDHRHHAVDAIVIAMTNRSTLQALARIRGTTETMPPPFDNFRDAVEEVVAGIKVSHKAVRDLSGALHDDTIYGPTSKPAFAKGKSQERPHAIHWIEDERVFVVRVSVEELTLAMVEDIRDAQVKAIIVERLQQFGIHAGRKEKAKKGEKKEKEKIPKDVWTKPLLMKRKTGRVSLQPSVIKKVRILKRDSTIRPIRGGTACVKPGNTHHIVLFELPAAAGKTPKRDLVAVTMLEVAQRIKRKQPLISRVHPTIHEAKFLFSLSWGEMVSATINGREDLYVFRTASSVTTQMKFVSHTDARKSAEAQAFLPRPNTLDGVKVTVDPLGRIRKAND